MRRWWPMVGLVAVLTLVVLGGWLLTLPQPGRGSALSRGPEGWLAARLYLEGRGAEVDLLDRSPAVAEPHGVLVEVFPWHRPDADRVRGLRRHLARGGTLVLAYSGGFGLAEDAAFEALGAPLRAVRDAPPLAPLAWRAAARRGWLLTAEGGAATELSLPAPMWVPRAPDAAAVLYRAPEGQPLVFSMRQSGGRLVVVPAAALANASLAKADNADLLEGLYAALGGAWAFDENAHGLIAEASGPEGRVGRVFDLLLIHLGVAYLLVVLALARRFGPAWRQRPAATGSVTTYLVGLGRLHHRLGHHAAAARRLVARWQELHPRLPIPSGSAAAGVVDGDGLVELAGSLSRLPALSLGAGEAARSGILPRDVAAPERGGEEVAE